VLHQAAASTSRHASRLLRSRLLHLLCLLVVGRSGGLLLLCCLAWLGFLATARVEMI
jgi:hypothetical protein